MSNFVDPKRVDTIFNQIMCYCPKITEATDEDVIATDGESVMFRNERSADQYMMFLNTMFECGTYVTYETGEEWHHVKLRKGKGYDF